MGATALNSIRFVTGNRNKALAMKEHIAVLGFDVIQTELALIEPQGQSIESVALSKATQAFQLLGEPLTVEDSGFCIDALCGFPGPYTRYILDTIGVSGLLRLAEPLDNRTCKFISALVYVDSGGEPHVFGDEGPGTLTTEIDLTASEEAWSDLWRIFIPVGAAKAFTALSPGERTALLTQWQANSVYTRFAAWLRSTQLDRMS